jgi:outer membrane protein assembly factor BamB
VYAGSNDSHLYALNAATGETRWEFETIDELDFDPVVADGTVYITDYKELRAIDAETGEERWSFGGDRYVVTSPVVAGDTVYFGLRYQHPHAVIVAVDVKNGQEKWRYPGDDTRVEDLTAGPVVHDGDVYFTDGTTYSISAEDGSLSWHSSRSGSIESLAVADGSVYVGTGGYSSSFDVAALSADDGTLRWKTGNEYATLGALTVTDGSVYAMVGDSNPENLVTMDAGDGSVLWETFLGSGSDFSLEQWNAPTVVGGTVYVGTPEWSVSGFDTTDCTELTRFETQGPVHTTPATTDGSVYFGSDDGYVYAFDIEE